MKKSEQLVDFMAQACSYAQEHCGDPQAWTTDKNERIQLLQCVSFQMACFLAQNTVQGDKGVEWEVVLEPLVSTKRGKNGFMMKSVEEWKKIINKIAKELGGWK